MDFQSKIRKFLSGIAQGGISALAPAAAPLAKPIVQQVGGFSQRLLSQVPQAISQTATNVGNQRFGLFPRPDAPTYGQFFDPGQFKPERLAPKLAQIQSNIDQKVFGFGPKGEPPPLPPSFGPLEGAGMIAVGGLTTKVAPRLAPLLPKTAGFSQFWNRARNVIGSQGPSGKALGGLLQQSRDFAETTAGSWVSKLPVTRSLSKGEFSNLVDVLEGAAKPLTTKVGAAAAEVKPVLDEVYTAAKQAGLDIGRRQNYFPHVFDPSMFKGDNYRKAIGHLVQTGQAKTELEAAQLLNHAQDLIRNRRQGNLELERLVDLPGYKKTPDALMGYLESAAKRIGDVTHFGKDDTQALALINQIAKEGGDASAVKNLFDISVGSKQYGELQKQLSSGLRKYQSVTKLGLGAVTNVGQTINTASVTGALRTMLASAKFAQPAARKEMSSFALKAGVTLDGVINDLREGAGFSGKVLGKITAPGFGKVEGFNRIVAAWSGKGYAEDLAQQAARGSTSAIRALERMGLDARAIAARGGRLSEAEQITAARRIVERTQFKVDPQDLPGWASSPWGKVLTQFKTFAYNQSAFIGRELIQPALKGDVRPLARFVTLAIPVGAGIKETKNLLQNRPSEQDPIKRYQQYFGQAGGLGLAQDVITGLFPQNGQYLDPNRATTLALSTLGGPTLGTAAEGYGSLTNALQGKPQNLERFGLRQIPLAGSTLQNTLLPYQPGGRAGGTADNQNLDQTIAGILADQQITPVEQAQLEQLRSGFNTQEKAVLTDTPKNLFGFQFGGLTTDQQNTQLTDLQAQEQRITDTVAGAKKLAELKTKNPIEAVIYQVADQALPGDDEFKKVLKALVVAESAGNPKAIGDNGASIGLLQANMAAGRGVGYTQAQLMDPKFNLELGLKEILPAYQEGRRLGLTGRLLTAYVSRAAQRPATGLEWNAADAYGAELGTSSLPTNEQVAGGVFSPLGSIALSRRISSVNSQIKDTYDLAQVGAIPLNQAASEIGQLQTTKVALQKLDNKPKKARTASFKVSKLRSLSSFKGRSGTVKLPNLTSKASLTVRSLKSPASKPIKFAGFSLKTKSGKKLKISKAKYRL